MNKSSPHLRGLRAIAVYKIAKVTLLLAAAYGELRLSDASVLGRLYFWAWTLPSGLEHRVVVRALEWFSGLSAKRIHALGIVTIAYAVLFSVEGIGLWLGRRWAEWVTTILTGSFIPLELWEVVHRPSLGKAAVLAINTAIVWYLIILIRQADGAGRTPPPG